MSKSQDINYKFPKERLKLLKLYRKDQNIRVKGDFTKVDTALKMSQIDLGNQKELTDILKVIKLPTVKNIGMDGVETVWLIGQHAGYNLEFMKNILKLTRQATKLNPENGYYRGIPYLVDRINVMEGKPQLYGTQFWANPKGKPIPYPIKDKVGLEDRRKKYGLRSFKDYQKDIMEATTDNNRKIYAIVY